MPPPCGHAPLRLPPEGEPYATAYCRTCWNYTHNETYRRHWDELPPPPPPQPLAAVPYEDWPAWVQGVARMRQEGEAGAGDTVKRVLTASGVDWFFRTFMVKMFGDCGCEKRRLNMNAKYPYVSASPTREGDGAPP